VERGRAPQHDPIVGAPGHDRHRGRHAAYPRTREESIRFARALSAGSHHDDWFDAMLPAVVVRLPESGAGASGLRGSAECLSIIQQAYRYDPSLAAPPR
jgi:hypothetical protein